MTGAPAPTGEAPLKLENHGFTASEVQSLNALVYSCMKGCEAELSTMVPIPRAKFLREAHGACKKFLHKTGGNHPDAPRSIIMPAGR